MASNQAQIPTTILMTMTMMTTSLTPKSLSTSSFSSKLSRRLLTGSSSGTWNKSTTRRSLHLTSRRSLIAVPITELKNWPNSKQTRRSKLIRTTPSSSIKTSQEISSWLNALSTTESFKISRRRQVDAHQAQILSLLNQPNQTTSCTFVLVCWPNAVQIQT